jgi:hypothetical protein
VLHGILDVVYYESLPFIFFICLIWLEIAAHTRHTAFRPHRIDERIFTGWDKVASWTDRMATFDEGLGQVRCDHFFLDLVKEAEIESLGL